MCITCSFVQGLVPLGNGALGPSNYASLAHKISAVEWLLICSMVTGVFIVCCCMRGSHMYATTVTVQ